MRRIGQVRGWRIWLRVSVGVEVSFAYMRRKALRFSALRVEDPLPLPGNGLSHRHNANEGSVRLRTTVRPIGQDEFDVDLLCHLPAANRYWHSSDDVYHRLGARLKENGIYERMCEPLKRCWRLQYADGERFHMDITPSIGNPECMNGGILVPDRTIHDWEPSNPLAYANTFDTASQKAPVFTAFGTRLFTEVMSKAYIEPMPERMESTDLLRRLVQVSKRHRDLMFKDDENGFPPISVIITTLLMHAYEDAVRRPHETPWDFVLAVVKLIPSYITIKDLGRGRYEFELPNPTTEGENFAERWNEDPRRARDFWRWHQQLTADLVTLATLDGEDRVRDHLTKRITGPETAKAFNRRRDLVNETRNRGRLTRLGGTGGLAAAQSHNAGARPHTFFGNRVKNPRAGMAQEAQPYRRKTHYGRKGKPGRALRPLQNAASALRLQHETTALGRASRVRIENKQAACRQSTSLARPPRTRRWPTDPAYLQHNKRPCLRRCRMRVPLSPQQSGLEQHAFAHVHNRTLGR